MLHGQTHTILVIDHSRTNLNVFGQRLGHLDYRVVLSESGGEALDLIAAGGIDLVLVEHVMPAMSGLDVLTELRGTPETADLPVIMVTGRSDPQAAVDALAAGADDHVAKPFAFEVLAARIERTLARAARLALLKRSNLALDARIATRAMELGEMREELDAIRADRARLAASIRTLHGEMERLAL